MGGREGGSCLDGMKIKGEKIWRLLTDVKYFLNKGAWRGVAIDSLKFHLERPCPTPYAYTLGTFRVRL
jgi:hypothetical protein